MKETFLNKGTYIKVHYNFNDKSEFTYYPKKLYVIFDLC